jgi:hypothetical protein
MIERIKEVSDTQKKEASAVDLVRYATDELTMSKVKQISKLEKEREEKERLIRIYPNLQKAMNAEINKINTIIKTLQGEISEREKLLNLKQAKVASFGISEEERQLIEAQNYARTFKEGTKERLDADIAAKKVERDLNLKNLKEKEKVNVSYFKMDANYNEKYATLRQEIISKTDEEILRMQDAFNKKRLKAQKTGGAKATDLSEFDAKKRLIKAEADLDRERFEQSIATNKAIADNQNKYFTLRIQAEDDIATKQYEQAKRTFEEKISLLENEEKAIEKIRAKGAKTEAERQKVSKNNTDAILAEKKLAEEEFVKTTLYIQDENQKQITKIYEQEVNKRLAIINGQLDAVQISGDNEKRVALEALKERFMAGEMKIKEYRAKAQTLEEEYDNKTLESKKKVIEKELYNFTQSEEVRTELKGKYNRLNESIEKNEFDSFVRTEDEKQKLREQIAQKQVELANEVANIIATINRAQNEQEIRDFEKKKELLQKDSELELYAIEQSSVAESEKANLKKVLAAETAAKEQEIANQIAEIKRKQAIADKAQALFSIALNTAIAVSQINASPAVNADPTQILRATLTKLVIGLGAVQAGIVLATPLPQYAKGKKASDGYEGLAIAGEKGTEMKIDKDGSLQLLTKPTLIHTKRGDTILSNRELMSGELGKHIKTDKEKANYDELIKAYSYHTDRTIKAIKNSPSNIIIDNSNYNLSLKRARV